MRRHSSMPDVHQLLECKEVVLHKQNEWISSLDQEDPEPPHIKEEQEEADITKFPFTPVPVKSEDDEEKPQSSQLHQSPTEENREAEPLTSSSTQHMETEADGDECGGSEPASNSDPLLQPDSDDKMSASSETDVSDEDWKETRDPPSSSKSLMNTDAIKSDPGCDTDEKPFGCSECSKRYRHKKNLQEHMRGHTGERNFSCSVCMKYLSNSGSLRNHMRIHTGEKPFICSVCGNRFTNSGNLKCHMRTHTGEKPFSCSFCDKTFRYRNHLIEHETCHTGEKPFSCSVCSKSFRQRHHLTSHMRFHSGEKPFSCSVCGKRFSQPHNVKPHMMRHSGEKPFSCSVCGRSFCQRAGLTQHMMSHSGEKPFSCSFCSKRFTHKGNLMCHMSVHTGEKRIKCSVCEERFTQHIQLKRHKCVGETSQLHQSQTEENRGADPPTSSSDVPADMTED